MPREPQHPESNWSIPFQEVTKCCSGTPFANAEKQCVEWAEKSGPKNSIGACMLIMFMMIIIHILMPVN
jgi:hypothetical protein